MKRLKNRVLKRGQIVLRGVNPVNNKRDEGGLWITITRGIFVALQGTTGMSDSAVVFL